MVFELLLSSWFLVLIRLCGEILLERTRRATTCEVARALRGGGVVLDQRTRDNAIVICVLPSPGPHGLKRLRPMTTRPRKPGQEPGGGDARDAEFSQFYRGSFAQLVGRCLRIGVPVADAPGLAQDLMLEIYRRWPDIESAERYASKVIAMRAVGFLKISAGTLPKDTADLVRLGQPLTSALPDGVLAVDEEQFVLEALRQLPSVQRAVFALDYDQFTSAEIAVILNMMEATVRSNLRHARATLRTWWNERAGWPGGRCDQ
jgi:DNA-directed RNA polymerase specialized sigma24 family protein